ncbi:MAG: hypothetical protein RR444_07505 [Oscillospiraceae bacterium]
MKNITLKMLSPVSKESFLNDLDHGVFQKRCKELGIELMPEKNQDDINEKWQIQEDNYDMER